MDNMTSVNWIETSEDNLPEHHQRVLFYKPSKLTKVGEMVYFETEKESFMEQVLYWAPELDKPAFKTTYKNDKVQIFEKI